MHRKYMISEGYSPKLHHPTRTSSRDKLTSVESEATEVWYATAEGVVGVADLQQSSTSSQVILDNITTC